MASLVRVGVYVPVWERGGHRVPGPDEDAFTLAATAVERAIGDGGDPRGPIWVDLVGDAGGIDLAALSAFVGPDAEIHPSSGADADLVSVVRSAAASPADGLVVAADLGRAAVDAGAVAWLFAAGAPTVPYAGGADSAPGARGPVALARSWAARAAPAELRRWVGDVASIASEARPLPTEVAPTAAPPSRAVSEGALVPRPQYLEAVPGHWRFRAERCSHCGRIGFPARGRCRECGRDDGLAEVGLPLDGGTVVATTWIGKGGQPTEFDPQVEATGSFGVALVDLAPGARATLQITDAAPGELRIGSRVGTRLRRSYSLEGEWRYARKAVPLPAR